MDDFIPDYEAAFAAALPFPAFLASVQVHRELWLGITARLPDLAEDGARLREAFDKAGAPPLRMLVLADDWCGDATNTVPVLARLMEVSESVDLRVVSRDLFPDVMDRHLTHGGRAIPMAILLSADGRPLGQWGPRPTELQALVRSVWKELDPEERYRHIRTWYARDRGRSTVAEATALVMGALAIQ